MNNNNGYMWILVVMMMGLFFAIFYFNPILYKAPWVLLRFIELSVILLWSNYISTVDYHGVLTAAHDRLLLGNWGTVRLDMMDVVDDILVHEYTGLFYAALFALYAYRRYSKEEFNTTLNFDQLLAQLSRHFRFARCMIHLDPTKGVDVLDFTQGPFRLKEKIIPFLKRNGAIGSLLLTPVSDETFYLNKAKADEVLLKTLGRKFTTVNNLHYYEKWLFAAFCLYIKSRKFGDKFCRDGDLILGDISYHINGEGNLKQANKMTEDVINKYINDPQIKTITKSHNYVHGVLRELFHQAKSRGTHPSFHFQWLFTIDRTLMLVLDETGMPNERVDNASASPEVASPESGIECLYSRLHWTNEKMARTRLYEPACSYIIDTIEEMLVNTYDFMPEREAIEILKEREDTAAAKEESTSALA